MERKGIEWKELRETGKEIGDRRRDKERNGAMEACFVNQFRGVATIGKVKKEFQFKIPS